jgi:hypothetical protein
MPLASQLRYTAAMKTATLPPLRVEPELRAEIESILGVGETLSEFVEASVRAQLERRRSQREFVTRGLAAIARTREHGGGIPADDVIARLEGKLEQARSRRRQGSK